MPCGATEPRFPCYLLFHPRGPARAVNEPLCPNPWRARQARHPVGAFLWALSQGVLNANAVEPPTVMRWPKQ